jgi:hypothetical protein
MFMIHQLLLVLPLIYCRAFMVILPPTSMMTKVEPPYDCFQFHHAGNRLLCYYWSDNIDDILAHSLVKVEIVKMLGRGGMRKGDL